MLRKISGVRSQSLFRSLVESRPFGDLDITTQNAFLSVFKNFGNVWTKYGYYLDRYPFWTNCVTAGSLFFAGDLICQGLERSSAFSHAFKPSNFGSDASAVTNAGFDISRAFRMGLFGFAFIGPFSVHWYNFLDKRWPKTVWKTVAWKTILDQFIFSPIYIPCFFIFEDLMQGHGWNTSYGNMKEKFFPTFLAEFAVWPIIQAVNFRFVKPSQRVIYISVVSLAWDVYLSRQQHTDAFNNQSHHQPASAHIAAAASALPRST